MTWCTQMRPKHCKACKRNRNSQSTAGSWMVFHPARNPEMWTPELFQSMAALSSPRAGFATFTAAGQVRRGLRDAHFSVSKAPGYGNKREMLSGRYDGSTETRPVVSPGTRRKGAQRWHLGPPSHRRARQAGRPVAAILGAGLAGAATAEALARRGWQVTVLERERVAAAASGNLQGVLYTRLSHRDSPLNSFTAHSYAFALRYYHRLAAAGSWRPGRDGEFCGVLQLLEHPDVDSELARVVAGLPNLVRYLGAAEAAAISGLKHCPGGLFYPEGGWLHPPAICRAMLQHPRITLLEDCGTVRVARAGTGWSLFDQRGTPLHQTPTLVIASGHEASQWTETRWLPLQKIRGQVTHLPSRGELGQLRTVICHTGFVAPARSGIHCIGASFDLGDEDPHLRTDSHQANLGKIAGKPWTLNAWTTPMQSICLAGSAFAAPAPITFPSWGRPPISARCGRILPFSAIMPGKTPGSTAPCCRGSI